MIKNALLKVGVWRQCNYHKKAQEAAHRAHFCGSQVTKTNWDPFENWLLVCQHHHQWQLLLISVQLSCSVVSDSLRPQHAGPPCPSPTPRVYSNSHPLSRWCHPTISCSVVPFSCLQAFPESGSFPVSQFFASGGQSIGVNIQGWFPLGWTCWISLQSKGLSRIFCNTTVQKHQFFGPQLSS